MSQVQIPKILLRYGRVNQPIRIPIYDLMVDVKAQTFLTLDTASGVGTLTVKNITGFAINQILLIGEPGMEGSEIIKTHASSAPSGSTITLASNTVFPHSASTNIYVLQYDQVELSSATTATGSKTVITTPSLVADSLETVYFDTTTSGYYFARWKNSITSSFSPYSDATPVGGYTAFMARSIIDNALQMINKQSSDIFSDEYGFQQINNCQIECLREFKRWSWMQAFDVSLGQLSVGQWRVALPSDCDDQNTNKSIWNFRIGTGENLQWVDKEKWNEATFGVAHTTLAVAISLNDVTITLTDSSNFPDSGTVQIGSNTYSYTANNRTTNVLTIAAATTTNTINTDVFSGASPGVPSIWTTFGGFVYFYPILGSSLPNREAIMDYYKFLTTITKDTDTIVMPDPNVAQYYLAWKFLLRMLGGEQTDASMAMEGEYKTRRETMKQKESMNHSFTMRPRKNRLDMINDSETRAQRLAGTPFA